MFRLVSPTWTSLYSPCSGPGLGGGFIDHPSAEAFLKAGAKEEFDCEARASFLHRGKDWISCENVESITEKVSWDKQSKAVWFPPVCNVRQSRLCSESVSRILPSRY